MRHRAALAAAVAAFAAMAAAPAGALPSFDAVRAAHAPSDLPLLDRHGVPIQWVRIDPTVRRGPWITLAETSPALREALVRSEDRRFWQHAGIDWRALAASAWANAWNTRTRGASTLTMQLAGLIDDDLARPAGGRSVPVKAAQMLAASQLEARWSKAQILEAYLNRVPLRGELVGIAAGAQQLFGKAPAGLDTIEAAILAALVRAPNAASAAIERRACELWREMDGVATGAGCEPVAIAVARALARRSGPVPGAEALAPHLARRIAAQARAAAPGTPPRALPPSTLDAGVQRVAVGALRRQLAELRGRNVEDGAAIVIDNASGEVLAWVGSAGAGVSSAAEVDAVMARRQPGSTIKPFVYALALERRLITAASRLEDSPLALPAGGSAVYEPRNYDHAWRGWVSARTALGSSLNVPAVRVAAMLGPDAIFERLQAAGLKPSHSAGWHGHALALGTADVTLLDLANAYRALARGGVLTPVAWTRAAAVPPPATRTTRVFDAGAAWLVADMLADPAARATGFGFDSPLVTRGYAAVKTGTSKDLRDNWCVGFTERYTVGVWVGNASGAPMHGTSGIAGAAPAWREIVAALHAGSPSRAPAPPAGLARIDGEWLLPGTRPALAGAPAAAPRFGITSPREGSVIALDPEIPPSRQRVVFEGAPGVWVLNGEVIGRGARVAWLPQPGGHRLERRDAGAAEGAGIDRVQFEVRAPAPARSPPARRAAAISPPNG